MKKIKKAKNIRDFLEIENINQDYIQFKDKIVIIYKVIPFNTNLKKSKNNHLITSIYRQFLDLYSDEFQILILNRNLDVSKYFNKKNKESNIFLDEYKKDLIEFLKNSIIKNNIVEEYYYITVSLPIGTDIKRIDEKLNIFKRNSIECIKLDKQQIIELINMSLFKGSNE